MQGNNGNGMKAKEKTAQTLASRLIAHRGYSESFPENSLSALHAACELGARFVEFDVQFSADGVPMVFHDDELRRITGSSGNIHQLTTADLREVRASESARFGERFRDEPLPTLEAVLQLLRQWPQTQAFVEIKQSSLEKFGTEMVAKRMVSALMDFQAQCILISFDIPVLVAARDAGMQRIGWVLSEWSEAVHQQAEHMAADYLFCNVKLIPEDEYLWPGDWQWALYDVVDPERAVYWFSRGAGFIETWDIGCLLRDPRLQTREIS